jgi:Flp pilus assembly protein TadG
MGRGERAQLQLGTRGHQLRREEGQSLILVVLALPLLLAIIALVIDGANLFTQRRSVQNAADAAAFAASAKLNTDLSACTGPDTDSTTCAYTVRTTAQEYSSRNGGQSSLHACVDGSDTNCYLTPYKTDNSRVQVRLKKSVSGFFTGAVGLSGLLSASASAVAGLSPANAGGNVAPIGVSQSDPDLCQPSNSSYPNCFDQPGVVLNFDDVSDYALLDLDQVSTRGPIVGGNVSTSTFGDWIQNGHAGVLPTNAWYGAEGDNGYHNGVKTYFSDDGTTVLLIPVFDARDPGTGSYHVIGFAAFVIEKDGVKWTNSGGGNHKLTGHFTTFVASGAGGGSNNFGVLVVTLFE